MTTLVRANHIDLASAIVSLACGDVTLKHEASLIVREAARGVRTASSAEDLGFSVGLSAFPRLMCPFWNRRFATAFERGRQLAMVEDSAKEDLLLEIEAGSLEPLLGGRWVAMNDALPALKKIVSAGLATCITLAALWSMPLQAEDRTYSAALDQRGQSGYSLSDRLSLSKLIRDWSAQCTVVTSCSDQQGQGEGRPLKGYPMRFDPSQGEAKTKLAAQ